MIDDDGAALIRRIVDERLRDAAQNDENGGRVRAAGLAARLDGIERQADNHVSRVELAAHLETMQTKLDGIKFTQAEAWRESRETGAETLREVRKTNGSVGDLANWRAMHTQEHAETSAYDKGQAGVLSLGWKVVIGLGTLMAMAATGANLWVALR